jgi:hypothetical protein
VLDSPAPSAVVGREVAEGSDWAPGRPGLADGVPFAASRAPDGGAAECPASWSEGIGSSEGGATGSPALGSPPSGSAARCPRAAGDGPPEGVVNDNGADPAASVARAARGSAGRLGLDTAQTTTRTSPSTTAAATARRRQNTAASRSIMH